MTPKTNWPVTAETLGLSLALTSDHVIDVFTASGGYLVIATEKALYYFGPNEDDTAFMWHTVDGTLWGESQAETLGQLGRDIALWLDGVNA